MRRHREGLSTYSVPLSLRKPNHGGELKTEQIGRTGNGGEQ